MYFEFFEPHSLDELVLCISLMNAPTGCVVQYFLIGLGSVQVLHHQGPPNFGHLCHQAHR